MQTLLAKAKREYGLLQSKHIEFDKSFSQYKDRYLKLSKNDYNIEAFLLLCSLIESEILLLIETDEIIVVAKTNDKNYQFFSTYLKNARISLGTLVNDILPLYINAYKDTGEMKNNLKVLKKMVSLRNQCSHFLLHNDLKTLNAQLSKENHQFIKAATRLIKVRGNVLNKNKQYIKSLQHSVDKKIAKYHEIYYLIDKIATQQTFYKNWQNKRYRNKVAKDIRSLFID